MDERDFADMERERDWLEEAQEDGNPIADFVTVKVNKQGYDAMVAEISRLRVSYASQLESHKHHHRREEDLCALLGVSREGLVERAQEMVEDTIPALQTAHNRMLSVAEGYRDEMRKFHDRAIAAEASLTAATEEVERLKGERDALRNGLDRISRPIWWMQEDCKDQHGKQIRALDGAMAYRLANSPEYLSGIAHETLKHVKDSRALPLTQEETK